MKRDSIHAELERLARRLEEEEDPIVLLQVLRDLAEEIGASARAEYLRLWEAVFRVPPPG